MKDASNLCHCQDMDARCDWPPLSGVAEIGFPALNWAQSQPIWHGTYINTVRSVALCMRYDLSRAWRNTVDGGSATLCVES